MDEKLLLLINREWTSPELDRLMAVVTSFDVWFPFVALAVAYLLWRGSFHLRACILTAGLILGIHDGLVARNLKRWIDRPRPHQSHQDVRTIDLAKAQPRMLAVVKPLKIRLSRPKAEEVDGRSFPSSHTMNTVTIAVVAAAFYGWRAWWLFLIAGAVSYSRIYTGVHWPSDVITSTVLAVGSSLLLVAVAAAVWRRWGPRFLPAVSARHPDLLAA